MNFFAEQDDARRKTRWLVGLFLLAVAAVIAITNLAVAICLWLMDGRLEAGDNTVSVLLNDVRRPLPDYFSWQNIGSISLLVSGIIFLAVVYKWLQLRGGGKKVALALGGQLIAPNTNDADQRRLLHVVEEMALAANMPVPAVYLLSHEKGINAFAAGLTPADAVIGVTQGALEQFDRNQLQGVIAHEFSHILNGDMRLNLQMVALLNGILFISGVGEFFMRSGGGGYRHASRRSGDFRLFLLGILLFVLGWLGVFLGGLIKAAISRQREFLADASAVQFTRNPDGIAGALKIIGGYEAGSRVFSASAGEMNHLFIANGLGAMLDFATHPPLARRIKKIEPGWDGRMSMRKMIVKPPPSMAAARDHLQRQSEAALAAVAGAAFVSERGRQLDQDASPMIKEGLRHQCRESFGALAIVYAMLLSDDEVIQERQLEWIRRCDILGLSIQVLQTRADIAQLDRSLWLALLEQAMPALKMLSAGQYKQFKNTLLLLIRADQRYEIFEWCLFELVRHYLAAEFEPSRSYRAQFKSVSEVEKPYALVLSLLAHHGHASESDAQRAFNRGANTAGLYRLQMLPADQCALDDFIKAANLLARCYPLLKPRLLKGLVDCARLDELIAPVEREIIAAMAAIMDCPQPDLSLDPP